MKPKALPFRPTRLTATQVADYIENELSPKESKEAEDQWAVSHCNLCASLIRKHLTLQWTKDLPTEPGVYWYRNVRVREAQIIEIKRNHNGALGNLYDSSDEWEFFTVEVLSAIDARAEWAGPIPMPEESAP